MASFITDLLDSVVKNIHPKQWFEDFKSSAFDEGKEREKFCIKLQKTKLDGTGNLEYLSPFMLAAADCMGSVRFYGKNQKKSTDKTLKDYEKRRMSLYFSGGGYELLDSLNKYGLGYLFRAVLILYRAIKFSVLILPRWLDFKLTEYYSAPWPIVKPKEESQTALMQASPTEPEVAPISQTKKQATPKKEPIIMKAIVQLIAKIPQSIFLLLRSAIDPIESARRAEKRGWGWVVVSVVAGAAVGFVGTGGIAAAVTGAAFVTTMAVSAASSSGPELTIRLAAGASVVVPDEDIGGVAGFIGGCFNGLTNLASRVYRKFVPEKKDEDDDLVFQDSMSVSESVSPVTRRNSNAADYLAVANASDVPDGVKRRYSMSDVDVANITSQTSSPPRNTRWGRYPSSSIRPIQCTIENSSNNVQHRINLKTHYVRSLSL